MTYIKEINGKWYAFEMDDDYHVYSIGNDNPREGRWFAQGKTDSAVQYVASASPNRKAAYQKAKRHGEYGGEV